MRSAFVSLNQGITYILEFDYRGYGIFSHNFVEVQVYGIWSFQSGTVYPGKVLVEPHTQRARMEITVPINAPVAIRFVAHGADADHAISVSNVQLVGIPTPIISHNPFRYAGMYWDGHRGEYYTPNRNFNPRLGRWNRPDPFFHAMNGTLQSCVLQAGNLFAYTMNNPVMWVDPLGLFSWSEANDHLFSLRYEVRKAGGEIDWDGTSALVSIWGVTVYFTSNDDDIRILNDLMHVQAATFYSAIVNAATQMVFMGTHPIAEAFGLVSHASVVIFASPSSDFWDHGYFTNNTLFRGSVRYATIGAGQWEDRLVGMANRTNDLNLSINNTMTHISNSVDIVTNLFNGLAHYQRYHNDSMSYTLVPIWPGQHNSNAFARGILRAAGIRRPPHPGVSVPGWNFPVPNSHFGGI